VDSSNKYGLCESSPASWNERNCRIRNQPSFFTTFKDPIRLSSENPDADVSGKTETDVHIDISGFNMTKTEFDVIITTREEGKSWVSTKSVFM